MAIALLDKGNTHLIAGSINGSQGTDAVLTTADGAASMTRNDVGDYTISFGAAFNSAPVVVANIVDATDSTDEAHSIAIKASNATDVQFNVKTSTTNGTATEILSALADLDFHFVVIGSRNR